uniref:Uncharacterized protein n=1 Tax=Anguilla anguilla TaxID=7936 RepID=A0A0E9TGT8_ANGAN
MWAHFCVCACVYIFKSILCEEIYG